MALKQGNGLQGWEIAVTKKLIGEFRRRSRSLYREEFDDLLQECLMHWLEVRQQLVPDPGGPPIAYMARVVRNKLIDLARERETDKRRGDQETVSLDDTCSAACGTELSCRPYTLVCVRVVTQQITSIERPARPDDPEGSLPKPWCTTAWVEPLWRGAPEN
jgi:DNA-directed RNA polymerase specialized sigma24 family protein